MTITTPFQHNNEAADPLDATVTTISSTNDSTNDCRIQPQPPIPDSPLLRVYSHCPQQGDRASV